MMRISEVAKEFNVTRQTVAKWIKTGVIKAIQPDRIYFISEKEVERLKKGELK